MSNNWSSVLLSLLKPGKHGGVGPLTGGHTEAGGPHQGPLVGAIIHHQRSPTVTLASRLHPERSFKRADHLKKFRFQIEKNVSLQFLVRDGEGRVLYAEVRRQNVDIGLPQDITGQGTRLQIFCFVCVAPSANHGLSGKQGFIRYLLINLYTHYKGMKRLTMK